VNTVLWIVAALLAAAFGAAGLMKLVQPKEKLVTSGLGWAEDYPAGAIKAIAGLEVIAAIGLVVPAALDIAPVLVPLAALGLVLIMVGAIVVHARRKENQPLLINVVLLILAAVVVWGRFGPYSF
jgi:uncharacterized membrane protein YphA (DoxX/SURF4 family)